MTDDETPPAVLVTPAEKAEARGALRTFIKALVPHLPEIAKYAGPAAVGFLLTTAHTWSEKYETDKKVAEVKTDAEATTKRAYKGLAKPTREISGELALALKRIDALEATQKAQSALIVARERDFVVEAKPATKAQRRRLDAGLVEAVKRNAAKDSKELAARKTKPAPAITPIPLELPPPSPPSPSVPPPPKVLDAGHSP